MAIGESPRSKFTEVQGIRLHYLEWGETGKPDLLVSARLDQLLIDLVHRRGVFSRTAFTSSRRTCAVMATPINRKPAIACGILPKTCAN